MNFCPKCECMLYTKIDIIDKSNKQLINYCKNCLWSGQYISDNKNKISVYKKTYTDDYVSETMYINPHIVHDNTLPRINNIKCINNNCVSNIDETNSVNIQIDNTISKEDSVIQNIETKDIIQICRTFLQSNNCKKYVLNKIAQNICVVSLNQHSDYTKLLSLEEIMIDNHNVNVNTFQPKKNEIIFIKYNKLDLKYMYICANCKTSWKN